MFFSDAMWRDLKAYVATIVYQILAQRVEHAREGVVVAGSYDPTEGSVEVLLGDTYGMSPDDGDTFATEAKVLLAGHHGQQQGPRGGERVVMIRSQSGYVAFAHHGDDDSPNAPSGEFHTTHYNAQGAIDVRVAATNDGAVAGDAKGGYAITGGSKISHATAGGLSIVADDNAGTITLTAGNAVVQLVKSSGDVFIGNAGLGPMQAAVTKQDLQNALDQSRAANQTALTLLAAETQGGSGVAPPQIARVIATGSSHVDVEE